MSAAAAAGGAGAPPAPAPAWETMSNNNFAFAKPIKPLEPNEKAFEEIRNFMPSDYLANKKREYIEKLAKYEKDMPTWEAAKVVRDAAKLKKREERRMLPESGRRMLPESGRIMPSEPLQHVVKYEEPYPHAAIAASSAAAEYQHRLEEPPKEAYEVRNGVGQVIKYGGRRSKKANHRSNHRSKKAKRRSSRRNRSI